VPAPLDRPRRRWFFRIILPLVFALFAYGGYRNPGDEYGLCGVGAIAGFWFIMLFGDHGSIEQIVTRAIIVGVITMFALGWLLDALRVRRRWCLPLWLVTAATICYTSIASYPSYDRAMSKNGSIWSYLFFSANFGLLISVLFAAAVAAPWRFVQWWRRPRPGCCQGCGYDLTGNVSGRCPECGRPTVARA
jgi:hypothetical protein